MLEYEQLCDKIINYENFAFSRYGDGEFYCIFKKSGTNCDKSFYFPDLGEALRVALLHPDYYIGTRIAGFTSRIKDLLTECQIAYKADVSMFSTANIKGYYKDFVRALDNRKVLLVSPEYMTNLGLFEFTQVKVDANNCWLDKEQIITEIIEQLTGTEDVVVLFTAGMASCVFIDRLHSIYGDKHTFIDVGSSLDPYVNHKSRSYIRNMDIKLINKC